MGNSSSSKDWTFGLITGLIIGIVSFGDTKTIEKKVELPVPIYPSKIDNTQDLNGDGINDIVQKYSDGTEHTIYSQKTLDGKINYTLESKTQWATTP